MAEVKVNKKQWQSLSAGEQEKIQKGLVETGALRKEDKITPSDDEPEFNENTEIAPMWNPLKDLCKAACDTTAAMAAAWCTANTAGLGLAVCLAAAEAARGACKDRC